MTVNASSLSTMLGLGAAPSEAEVDVILKNPCFAALGKGIFAALPQELRKAAAKQVAKTLNDAFDYPLGQAVGNAWNKYAELIKYTDSKRYPAETRTLVEFAKHTITSSHTRDVQVFYNGEPITTVPFKLEMSITLNAAKVVIQNGRFMSIQVGSVAFRGTVFCGKAKLLERASSGYRIPGEMSLGSGIAINPFQQPAGVESVREAVLPA